MAEGFEGEEKDDANDGETEKRRRHDLLIGREKTTRSCGVPERNRKQAVSGRTLEDDPTRTR